MTAWDAKKIRAYAKRGLARGDGNGDPPERNPHLHQPGRRAAGAGIGKRFRWRRHSAILHEQGTMTRALTPQRQAFAAAYIANGRQGVAAHRAAYPGTMSPQTRANGAYRLLKDPRIQALVADADRREQAARDVVAERLAITKQRLAARLAAIVFAGPIAYLVSDGKGVPKLDYEKLAEAQAKGLVEVMVDDIELSSREARRGRRIRVRPVDRVAVLMKLARLMGYLPEQRLIQGVADLTQEEIDALVDDTSDRSDATVEPGAAD